RRSAQSARRLASAGQVGAIGRSAGVEEAPERLAEGVVVRMANRCGGLVDDAETGEQHAPRPVLVLAHDDVLDEREAPPQLPRHQIGRASCRERGEIAMWK